jgi:hypothetical protein
MGQERGTHSLEQALCTTEAETDGALKAATAADKALKHLRAMVHVGNLRELQAAFVAAEQAVDGLRQQLAVAIASWDFDQDTYFADGSYTRELLETAAAMGVDIVEADDRLYSYPMLLRVLGNERTVMIDRTRERRLRPTVLVSRLSDLRKRPPRFRPAAFLETLHKVYVVLEAARGKDLRMRGVVVRLLDVYQLLTPMPGQSREYSRQEFARDVYLLDRSGTTTTRTGFTASLPSSTGTKSRAGTLTVITESGHEQTYYGIAFTHSGAV